MVTIKDQFVAMAQPGDLALFHYPGFQFTSDAIEWFEGSGRVSHNAMVVDGAGGLSDVRLSGVIRSNIDDYIDGRTKIILRRVRGIGAG